MSRYAGQSKEIHDKKRKTGVLLTNLGTPDSPTTPALRRYLRQFLSDRRVVEIPRLLWLIILHGIILRLRPKKSAKLYQSIWTEQGSPLLVITLQQKEKVAEHFSKQYGDNVLVDIGMRYGNPSIDSALENFQRQGVDNIVVLPLYPQYGGPTTGSTFDAVVNRIKQWRWVPSVHFQSGYHDHPLYIEALAASIEKHFIDFGKPEKLLLSYHGMPKYFLDQGDPYYCFSHKTTRLVVERLGLSEDDYVMTFQSRFGKAEWLKPYTDETLTKLAQEGVNKVAVISPAFSADCLETLEELVHENKEIFLCAGGEEYHYIAALNDDEKHIAALVDIIEPHIR